jgi:hypothetical protein
VGGLIFTQGQLSPQVGGLIFTQGQLSPQVGGLIVSAMPVAARKEIARVITVSSLRIVMGFLFCFELCYGSNKLQSILCA